LTTTTADDCLIRFATADQWLFADDDVVQLLRRIARAEIAFFGSAPESLITCLLATNPVAGAERFDAYGIHTGSSILLLLEAQTTYADLNENAVSVIAHEMFHGWLGEAIRQEDHATLWFTEGATTLYAARMLAAAHIWSDVYARQVIAGRIERDYTASARRGRLSVAAAAAQVMADPVTIRFGYAGGVAVCLGLERWLTAQGAGPDPLAAVLRYLYAHRSEAVLSRATIEAAVRATADLECGAWLDRYVYGTESLPPVEPMI
jgi:predicted metalloprotease with PDZ domain